MTEYLIGLDIGTTNIKGSLYDEKGNFIDSSSYGYESYSQKQNFHEQNPEDWYALSVKILKDICKNTLIKTNLKAISLSTQGGTFVLLDKKYKPLDRAITWLDRRGFELFETTKQLQKQNIRFYTKTGWRLDSCFGFMPIYWTKIKKPDVFSKIHRIMFVNDYLALRFTGNAVMDPSNASITLLYNVLENKWDNEILDMLGLSEKNFSEIKRSGTIVGGLKEDIKKEIGLFGDVIVVNGAHDQYCSALGAGIVNANQLLLTTGTAWVLFKLLENPLFDEKQFFAVGRNILEKKFGLIYTIPSAGAAIKWFSKNIMCLKSDMDLINRINDNAKEFLSIKNNIIFYPYLTGAFGPEFNPLKKASINNIEIGHTYMDIIKSIFEGVCFQAKKIISELEKKNITFNQIKMVGGGSKSKVWPNILADIINKNILIPTNQEDDLTTKGAAIIAGIGAGIFDSFEDGCKIIKTVYKKITPGEINKNFYKLKYSDFLQ